MPKNANQTWNKDRRMANIAEFLGVEIGQRFNLRERETGTILSCFFIDNNGFWDGNCHDATSTLIDLLAGRYEIIQAPWKPKEDNVYWFTDAEGDSTWARWHGTVSDLALFAVGNCYGSIKEAEEKGRKTLKKLQDIYRNGVPILSEED